LASLHTCTKKKDSKKAHSIFILQIFNLNDVQHMFLARMAEKLYQESLQVIDQIIESLSLNVRRKTVQIIRDFGYKYLSQQCG
jgi:hypothetical protein